jgi:hypothetical protein
MDLSGTTVLLRATATPTDRPAAILVVFLPRTALTQPQASELSAGGLADYDQALRRKVESLFKAHGLTLVEWRGTRKDVLNGRVTLVSEYRRQRPGQPSVWEQVNTLPLADGTVVLTVSHSEQAGLLWRSLVMRIRSSCRVNEEQ